MKNIFLFISALLFAVLINPVSVLASDIATPSNAELFAAEYQEKVQVAIADGIDMKEANDKESLKVFFENLAPSYKDGIKFEVEITDREDAGPGKFVAAIAGTRYDRAGKNGSGGVRIYISSSIDGSSTKIQELFHINATKYTVSSSSGGGSSSGGSSSNGGNAHSSKQNSLNSVSIRQAPVDIGTWENISGKWKLRKEDGSYANSQWGYIKEKWYLFGNDDYMVTGWKKANEKWYYFDENGGMQTGWLNLNGIWYWTESSGEMVTGWKNIDGKWI